MTAPGGAGGEARSPTDGTLRVCAVQAAPVFLDRAAPVAKACTLIAAAVVRGADLAATGAAEGP